jgi:hypothetical protein
MPIAPRQRVVAVTLVAVFCAACGDSPGAGAPTRNESDAGAAGAPACPHPLEAPAFDPEEATWPAPVALHLPGVVDAYNVTIDPSGELRLRVHGCDFGARGCARWVTDGSDVVVLAPAGMELPWPRASGVESVRLSRVSTGIVTATIDTIDGTRSEDWEFGEICAECCGGLGPSGLYTCEGSLEDLCE